MALKYKKDNKKVYIFFAVISLVVFLLSSSVIPFINEKSTLPTADLCLCLVCIMPIFLPFKAVCIYAVSLGFLCDLFINAPSSLSPVIYLFAACVTPFVLSRFARKGAIVTGVCSVPAFAARSICGCLTVFLTYGRTNAGSLALYGFTEICVNLAVCIVLGAAVGFVADKTGTGSAA